MVRGFDHCLQFLTGVESDDAASRDGDFLTRLGVAPRPLRLFAELEIAETGQLDAVVRFERDADFLEEALDHVLGFALVESELLKKQIGKFGFGKRHWSPPKNPSGAACRRIDSLFPAAVPPRSRRFRRPSKSAMWSTEDGLTATSASSTAWAEMVSSTTTARSRRTTGSFEIGRATGCSRRSSGARSSSNTTAARGNSNAASSRGCSSPSQPAGSPSIRTRAERPALHPGRSARVLIDG